jgi:hypothetical protein
MRGTPEIVPGLTTAGAGSALAVLASEIERTSVGDLLKRALRRFAGPVVFVHHSPSGLTIATEDAATSVAILAAWDADAGGELRLTPRANQWGQNLLWQATGDTLGNPLLTGLVGNEYQRRNVWGMVNTALSSYRLTPPAPSVLVDQNNGAVMFKHADIETALRSLNPAGETVAVEWWIEPANLIFE